MVERDEDVDGGVVAQPGTTPARPGLAAGPINRPGDFGARVDGDGWGRGRTDEGGAQCRLRRCMEGTEKKGGRCRRDDWRSGRPATPLLFISAVGRSGGTPWTGLAICLYNLRCR